MITISLGGLWHGAAWSFVIALLTEGYWVGWPALPRVVGLLCAPLHVLERFARL